MHRNQSHCTASGCASRSLAAARPPHAGTRQRGRFGSESVLTAAMIGPTVGSAARRVGAGDSRAACIETRATALHLAVLVARSQLPDPRMQPGSAQPACRSGAALVSMKPCRLPPGPTRGAANAAIAPLATFAGHAVDENGACCLSAAVGPRTNAVMRRPLRRQAGYAAERLQQPHGVPCCRCRWRATSALVTRGVALSSPAPLARPTAELDWLAESAGERGVAPGAWAG